MFSLFLFPKVVYMFKTLVELAYKNHRSEAFEGETSLITILISLLLIGLFNLFTFSYNILAFYMFLVMYPFHVVFKFIDVLFVHNIFIIFFSAVSTLFPCLSFCIFLICLFSPYLDWPSQKVLSLWCFQSTRLWFC